MQALGDWPKDVFLQEIVCCICIPCHIVLLVESVACTYAFVDFFLANNDSMHLKSTILSEQSDALCVS